MKLGPTCGIAFILAVPPAAALSQAYPSRPIHIVTQFAAGSSGDQIFRAMGPELSVIAGQPVVVENRAGGAGVVALANVAAAQPDGYTLLGATSAPFTTDMFVSKKREVDTTRQLQVVTKVGESITVYVASEKLPVSSMKEMIEFARANPGKITYGSSGIGGPHHLSGEQIKQLTGINIRHVPYKATSQALQDTVSGEISSTFSIYAVTVPHIQSGRVRVLAVRHDKRVPQLPDVPTLGEVIPGFQVPPSWVGLFAPAGMPDALLRRVHALSTRAIMSPRTVDRLAPGGFVCEISTPEEFTQLIRSQTELVGRIMKTAGIKPQ